MSPILIDVDGSGFQMTDAVNGVLYDFYGIQVKLQISWTARGSTNAWLVMDRNGNGVNGVSEGSELHTLPDLDVESISLDFRESRRTDRHGNQFRYRAKVKDSQGVQLGRWAWDVFLVPQ